MTVTDAPTWIPRARGRPGEGIRALVLSIAFCEILQKISRNSLQKGSFSACHLLILFSTFAYMKISLRRALSAASTCAVVVLSALSASADTPTITTDPVGVVVHEVPQGRSVLSVPFVGTSVYEGIVASNTDVTVTFETSGIPDLTGHPYYIHVLDGAFAGENITIVEASSNAVSLELATAGDLSGASVAIRPHVTIGTLFDGVSLPGEPTLTLYESNGSVSSYTYYSALGWVDENFNSAENVIIFPGEGLIFNVSAGFDLPFSGTVLTAPMAVLVGNLGVSIVGSINPAESVSIEQLDFVNALTEETTITFYQNSGGSFSVAESLTKLNALGGFVDTNFNLRNDYPVDIAGAGVIRSPMTSIVIIPPAYVASIE